VEGELHVPVAVLGTAHAGDARVARQAARLGDEPPGMAGSDREAGAPDRARRAGGDARRGTAGAAVAGRRHGRQRAIENDERTVGPPGTEARVNLQPERPRSAQACCAPEALERNEGTCVERESHGVGNRDRLECRANRVGDDPRGVAIEGVGRAVGRLGLALEQIEERRTAGADDQRARRAGQEIGKAERRRRRLEGLPRERQQDVQAERTERARQRRERVGERSGGGGAGRVAGRSLAGREALL
jgi:hypothetical protein